MIECPSCKSQHFVGTLYCSECGTRLVHVTPVPTLTISELESMQAAAKTKPTPADGPDAGRQHADEAPVAEPHSAGFAAAPEHSGEGRPHSV